MLYAICTLSEPNAVMTHSSGSLDNVVKFITVLFIFVICLAVTYFSTRYIAEYQKSKLVGGNIEVIETVQLAQNKYVQIIRVGDKYYSIVTCKDNVTLLGEISKDNINLDDAKNKLPPSFKDIITMAKNKLTSDDEGKHLLEDDNSQEKK